MGVEEGENRDLGGEERVTRSMVTLGTCYEAVAERVEVGKGAKEEKWWKKPVNSQ